MAQVDPQQEIQRLAALYAGMVDSQLAALAEEAHSLTDESREALSRELLQRGLDVEVNTQSLSQTLLSFVSWSPSVSSSICPMHC